MSKPEVIEERKFTAQVNRMGGEAIKLSTQGYYGKRGFNDRCVFIYPGVVAVFEFKRKHGGVVRKLQKYRHKRFKKMLIPCFVVYTAKFALKVLKKLIKQAKENRRRLSHIPTYDI